MNTQRIRKYIHTKKESRKQTRFMNRIDSVIPLDKQKTGVNCALFPMGRKNKTTSR